MSYYLEIWLRGYAKDRLRKASSQDPEKFHPHITLVRPFDILTNEQIVKDKIVQYCKGKNPISYTLKGKNSFNNKVFYVPVTQNEELLQFDSEIEELIGHDVKFYEKLNEQKILHATIDFDNDIPEVEKIDQYMLRLTAIKDKKIWFSYDFVVQKELTREESLDKSKWYKTVNMFANNFKLLPTRNGYKRISQD